MELATGKHDITADLARLVEALEHARANGQTRVVDYLEAVLDDMVFEMELVTWRDGALTAQSTQRYRYSP